MSTLPPDHGPSHQSAAEKTLNALCSACKSIFARTDHNENPPTSENGAETHNAASGTHHQTAQACKDAADQECPICRVVWLRATEYGKFTGIFDLNLQGTFSTWNARLNDSSSYNVTTWPADRRVLNINIGSVLKARGLGIVHTFTYGDVAFSLESAGEYQGLVANEVVSLNTSAEETWRVVEKWYETCRSTCKCVGRFSGTMRPTRLIDIGENEGDLLYVRSEATLPQDVEYVCLSHCWGGLMAEALYDPSLEWTANIGLTTTSVDKDGFSWSDQSKTFKDAVSIVRKLGKRFLWIDMLCIVQNDVEDWKRESAVMGRIYLGAYLTLVADDAKNSSFGLFNDRNPDAVRPMVVRPEWSTDVSGQDWVLIPADFWQGLVSQSSTGQRAWCLQERWLSPALIHFGKTQVAWECKQMDCCETFPDGLPDALQDVHAHFSSTSKEHVKRLRQLSATTQAQDDDNDDRQQDTYYIWSQLIEKYARTSITKDSDRLIAVAGLGDLFERVANTSLISSLWFSILPSQLLWAIDSGYRSAIIHAPDDAEDLSPWQPQGRRPTVRNAPTWSWASVNGPLIMPTPLEEGALVDVQVLPPNDMSSIGTTEFHRDAKLIVTGVLHKGLLIWNGRWNRWMMAMNLVGFGSRHIYVHSQKVDKFPLAPYTEITAPEKVATGSKFPQLSSETGDHIFGLANPDTDTSVPDVAKSGKVGPAFCLVVMDTKKHAKYALHNDPSFTTCGISGLLLAPVPGPQGMYSRLGTFDLIGDTIPQLGVSFGADNEDNLFMGSGHRALVLV